jgi:hypothetical protein
MSAWPARSCAGFWGFGWAPHPEDTSTGEHTRKLARNLMAFLPDAPTQLAWRMVRVPYSSQEHDLRIVALAGFILALGAQQRT